MRRYQEAILQCKEVLTQLPNIDRHSRTARSVCYLRQSHYFQILGRLEGRLNAAEAACEEDPNFGQASQTRRASETAFMTPNKS